MKKNYQAVLFHPEGDYVTDFRNNDNVSDVCEAIGGMGSRWIFYPIAFVATDKTIVDTPEGMELLKGKRIKTVKKLLNNEWEKYADNICNDIKNGLPMSMVYNYEFAAI